MIARFVDVGIRGQFAAAFALDFPSKLFLLENLVILAPAVVLLSPKLNQIPRVVFVMSIVTCVGGLAYRFIPTTITYDPGAGFAYFPSVPELFITTGLVVLLDRALQRGREALRDPARPPQLLVRALGLPAQALP